MLDRGTVQVKKKASLHLQYCSLYTSPPGMQQMKTEHSGRSILTLTAATLLQSCCAELLHPEEHLYGIG